MSLNVGGSDSRSGGTTQINLPAASPGQKELQDLNLQLAKIQAGEYLQGLKEQQDFRNSPLFATQNAIEQKASDNLLARLQGTAPVLNPDEQKRLDEVYGNTQRLGEQNLNRYAQETAAQRGMSVSDSPIGNEALRQQQEFTTNLGAQKAASAFDLGNSSQAFNQQLASFQASLRQQALANRLSMASNAPASFGLQSQLFGQQLAQAPRSFTGTNTGFNWGAGVNGQQAGGVMQGLGAMGVGG